MANYTLDVQGRQLVAASPFSVLQQLSLTDGARRQSGSVTLPLTAEAMLIAEAVAIAEVTPAYRRARQSAFRPTLAQLQAVEQGLTELVCCRDTGLLLHQWEFLAHCLPTDGMLNASEQGLGKTRMALTALYLWQVNRALLIMPKDLVNQWNAELIALIGQGFPEVLFQDLTKGTKAERSERLRSLQMAARGRVWVAVNYEVLADKELYAAISRWSPEAIVADESWRIKNPTAKTTKAALKLADEMRARFEDGRLFRAKTLALSGTPVGNDIGDLWAQLRFLGSDAVSGLTHWEFLRRFATLQPLTIGQRTVQVPNGISDPAGLMRLVRPNWFRATKAACLTLPPKVHQTIRLTLPEEARVIYDDVTERGEQALGNDFALTGEAVKMLRQQQICGGIQAVWNGSSLDEPDAEGLEDLFNGSPGSDWLFRHIPSAKLDWLCNWTENRLVEHPTTRVIVWCRFNSEVQRIAVELTNILGAERVAIIWGGMATDDIDAIKESFNSRHARGVQVIVAQVKKLFNGHNLQSCDWNIDFSLDWSYIVNAQKEDRSHRYGRETEVNYIQLVCEGTVEETIVEALANKENIAARTVQNTATVVNRT